MSTDDTLTDEELARLYLTEEFHSLVYGEPKSVPKDNNSNSLHPDTAQSTSTSHGPVRSHSRSPSRESRHEPYPSPGNSTGSTIKEKTDNPHTNLPSTKTSTPGFKRPLTKFEKESLGKFCSLITDVKKPGQYTGTLYGSCSTQKLKGSVWRTKNYGVNLLTQNHMPIPWPIKGRHLDSEDALLDGWECVKNYTHLAKDNSVTPEMFSTVRKVLSESERLETQQNTIKDLFAGPLCTSDIHSRSLFAIVTSGSTMGQLTDAVNSLKQKREEDSFPKDTEQLYNTITVLKTCKWGQYHRRFAGPKRIDSIITDLEHAIQLAETSSSAGELEVSSSATLEN